MNNCLTRIWRVVKITTCLLIIGSLHISAASLSQTVTLSVKDRSFAEVLLAIQEQTGFFALSSMDVLAKARPVSLQLKNTPIEESLRVLFKNQPLTYEINGTNILIKEADAPSRLNRHPRQVGAGSERSAAESNGSLLILAFPEVRGKIVDSLGQPLSGASIRVLDAQGQRTSLQTQTDRNGGFMLRNVPEGAFLEISYVGYITAALPAAANMGTVVLRELSSTLQEVEINKGYYSQKKLLNTGSVTTVFAEDIAKQPVSDPLLALQGRISGLSIRQQNGIPGREVIIRLRGQNSLDNGNNPLFLVDGIQFNSTTPSFSGTTGISQLPLGAGASPFNFLNPEDIESISVLKDADATAIYGSRGANGVILITTKKGTAGKAKLDVNYYTGFSTAPQRLNFLNTSSYLQMRRQAFINDEQTPRTTDYDLNGTWDTTAYTNWQNLFIGETANVNNITAAISGGNQNTNFRVGSTYRKEGMILPDDFETKKIGLQFNVEHSSEKNNFKMSLTGSYLNNNNNLPSGVFNPNEVFSLAPNMPFPLNPDRTLNWAPNSEWANPMSSFERKTTETSSNLISNFNLTYNPVKSLEVKANFAFNKLNFNQTNITPFTSVHPSAASVASLVRTNEFITSETNTWVIEPQISYSPNFLGGQLEMLIGSTFQSNDRNQLAMSASGFSTDELIESFGAGTSVTTRGRSLTQYRYSAAYARLAYSYLDRYVVNVTGRRDGSSRFGPENRFGNFGAIGVAWIFSNEEFFKKSSSFLNYGKLRASYGSTGNDQLTDYQYLDTYSSNTNFYQSISSLSPTQLTNPYYGWERVDKMEFGLELAALENKISANVNYYKNRTKNQLVLYALPSVTGFTNVRANLPAILQNSGIELEISSTNIHSENFTWTTSANVSIPRDKLISYPKIQASSYATRYQVGMPLSLFRGYHYTGLDPNAGTYSFEDINGDGSITSTGDSRFNVLRQNYFGGVGNNFKYRNFELDVFVQFVRQNGRQFLGSAVPPGFFNFGRSNQQEFILDSQLHQTLSQSKAEISRGQSLFSISDASIADASFVRLKNLSVAWNLPVPNGLKKFILSSRIYYQAQNLFTISKYKGVDPESPSNSISIPTLVMHSFGLQTRF